MRERSSRTLTESMALRFPRVRIACMRALSRRPPSSRIRQALVWRGVELVIEAYNRRDLEVLLSSYHPDVEIHPAPEAVQSGLLEPAYLGHEGCRRYTAELFRVWADLRVEPRELIDTGDRVVLLGTAVATPVSSDAPLMQTFASVHTWQDGLVIRHDNYFAHADALNAVGLSE